MHHKCQDTLWSLTKGYSMSVIVCNRRRTGQNFFFFAKIDLILRNLVLDFLCPKQMILSIAPYLLKNIVNSYILFTDIFCVRYFEKMLAKFFHSLERMLFFKKVCFQQILGPKTWFYYFHSSCQIIFLALLNRFLRFVTLDSSKKHRAITFLHWRDCLFSKNLCFKQPLRSQKRSYTLHHKCQDTLWSLTKEFSRSVMVGNRRRYGPEPFFLRDVTFNFEKIGSRLLRS